MIKDEAQKHGSVGVGTIQRRSAAQQCPRANENINRQQSTLSSGKEFSLHWLPLEARQTPTCSQDDGTERFVQDRHRWAAAEHP